MGKITKDYTCPYCGRRFNDALWSVDHIIPRDIGGPKRFCVVSCRECNSRIGKEIEQRMLISIPLRVLFSDQIINGHRIKTRRRRKGSYPTHKRYGLSGGRKVQLRRNMATGDTELWFLDGPPSPTARRATFICEEPEDVPLFGRFVHKVALGSLSWFWGEEVAHSMGMVLLRDGLWSEEEAESLTLMDPDERHFAFHTVESGEQQAAQRIDQDALDNRPHHTVGIFSHGNTVSILVNLFGELESMIRIGDGEISRRIPEEEGGVILIIKTTDNSVATMKLRDYIKAKSSLTGKDLDLVCEAPFSR